MKTSNYYYVLLGMSITGLILFVFKDQIISPTGQMNPNAATAIIVIVAMVAIAMIIALPILYRRSLEKRNNKDLSRVLLQNPQFRDAILKSRAKGQAPAHISGPKTDEKTK